MFNVVGVFMCWNVQLQMQLFVGYSYMCGSDVDGIDNCVQYYNVMFGVVYDLLKCISVYLFGVYQYVFGMMFDVFGWLVVVIVLVFDKVNGYLFDLCLQVIVSFGLCQKF